MRKIARFLLVPKWPRDWFDATTNHGSLMCQLIIKNLLSRRYPKITLASLSLYNMAGYIWFSFEDFDKDCIVLVNNLPKIFAEDKLLRLFQPHGRIRMVGKACGETSSVYYFNYFIATYIF